MSQLIALFNALAAIPKIAGYLEQLAIAFSVWYLGRVQDENRQVIADAAAFALRAKTPQDRSIALDKWAAALRRKRILP